MRSSRPAVFLVPLALVATSCFDDQLVGEAGGEGAPSAVLVLSASAGQAPLEIVLDASGSAAFEGKGKLRFDYDVDGDGDFEVEGSDESTLVHTYTSGGTFRPLVRVVGEDSRYDVDEADLDVLPDNPPRTADIDVDSNADGRITGADDAVEDDAEAPFVGNIDDDDGDGERDRDDLKLDAEDDDTFPVLVRHVRGLDGARVFIEISPAIAASRTRLWRDGSVLVDEQTPRAEVAGAGDADVELRLEAITGRTGDYDGRVTLTVTVEGDAGVVSSDDVLLRAAPVIFPDNLQAPKRLFVMDIPDGGDNNQALIEAFEDSLPNDVDLYTLDANSYSYDRWVQDSWEVGYQTVPDENGAQREVITAMQLERFYGGQGLDAFVPGEWIGSGRGFYYPSGSETSHNYGGNLETAPPTSQYPFGRMLYGGGESTLTGQRNPDTMNDEQVSFLAAQEIQGQPLEVSSEWLAVGHIDEIFQFVPDLSPDGEHNFKVVIASPRMARDVLLSLRADGEGGAFVFESCRASYSVDEILDAEQFNGLNELAQARIDEVQDELSRELGLSADDFLPVPVLFDEAGGGGLVVAFNPGIQNLVTVGDRLFAPDPEGPIIGGEDRWQEATRASLATTDLDVIFVDVFESYHELMGEAHCGTNLEREHYATAWWTVKE